MSWIERKAKNSLMKGNISKLRKSISSLPISPRICQNPNIPRRSLMKLKTWTLTPRKTTFAATSRLLMSGARKTSENSPSKHWTTCYISDQTIIWSYSSKLNGYSVKECSMTPTELRWNQTPWSRTRQQSSLLRRSAGRSRTRERSKSPSINDSPYSTYDITI